MSLLAPNWNENEIENEGARGGQLISQHARQPAWHCVALSPLEGRILMHWIMFSSGRAAQGALRQVVLHIGPPRRHIIAFDLPLWHPRRHFRFLRFFQTPGQ